MRIQTSSWLTGFEPTSLLLALVVATPVSAYRRFWAVVVGFAIVHVFVLARLGATVLLNQGGAPDGFWGEAVGWVVFDLVHGRAGGLLVPVLIWVAVTFRRDDVQVLIGECHRPDARPVRRGRAAVRRGRDPAVRDSAVPGRP